MPGDATETCVERAQVAAPGDSLILWTQSARGRDREVDTENPRLPLRVCETAGQRALFIYALVGGGLA